MRNDNFNQRNRIAFLDALRGLAVISVVVYHAYGPAYADFLPFGTQYSVIPIRLLWAGVQLFFLISGFVILMTLEKCKGFLDFLSRRWLRLFPAMLAVSILILIFDLAFNIGPHTPRTPINLIPGLLFISPSVLHTVTGLTVDSMDGPFWTIYVEVLFYCVFGLAFFQLGERKAIAALLLMHLGSYACRWISIAGVGGHLLQRVSAALDWLGFTQFGWFAAGAIFYRYYKTHNPRLGVIAATVGAFCAFTTQSSSPFPYEMPERAALIFVVSLFSAALFSERIQQWLSVNFLIFFGAISYPLYLLHDNISIGVTQWIGRNWSIIPPPLAPVLPVLAVCIVAWVIARYFEPAIRAFLRRCGRSAHAAFEA